MQADIGLIGLAVMGQNLVLNMNDHGFSVAVFNRSRAATEAFLAGPASGRPGIAGAASLGELVASLARPRKVMLLIKAGAPVDEMIASLSPLLAPGDLIIDGGNPSRTTVRRAAELAAKGLRFIGLGRVRRRGGRAPRPPIDARRGPRGLAPREGHLHPR